MATVVYDTVKDAELNIDNTRVSFVRTGYIKDFDVTLEPAKILAAAANESGLPVRFTPHPYFPYAILQRYQFTTQRSVNWRLWFKLIYETPEGRNPAGDSLFTLERSRGYSATSITAHPKDGYTLDGAWVDPKNPANVIVKPAVTMSYFAPFLVLTAKGYVAGALPDAYVSAFNSVNATPWQGYPKGYWRYEGADDFTNDFGNSYTVQLKFTTKVIADWSQTEVLRDPRTGEFLRVSFDDMSKAKNASYFYGKINWNGIFKVGFYPLNEFNDIFGF
jgi:hypothetical protein